MIKGFTLLEVLLVTAILVVMATVATGYYRNYAKSVELNQSANEILAELKLARQKAIAGEDDKKWGIRFDNGTDDKYELFSTATDYVSGTIVETVFLKGGVAFTAPPSASSTDVLFNKITGSANNAAITISSEGNTKTITVTGVGNIY